MTQPPRPAALVTGGAVRLGRAIALELAAAGYDIALHYQSSTTAAQHTREEILALGVDCRLCPQDLAQTSDLDPWLKELAAAMPALEVLINSASGYIQADIAQTRPEDFDQLLAVNLKAPFFLTQAFGRHLGRGQIINIIDNKIGFNQYKYAAYLLSKKALAEFTRMAALEFAPHIRVNGIAPGVILPAASRSAAYLAWRAEAIPLLRQGNSGHITASILHLLRNDFINGQVLVVDGGENIAHSGRNAGEFNPQEV